MREERVGQQEVVALERNRSAPLADQSARRDDGHVGLLLILEAHERALAPRSRKRPAEARVQAAGERRAAHLRD